MLFPAGGVEPDGRAFYSRYHYVPIYKDLLYINIDSKSKLYLGTDWNTLVQYSMCMEKG